STIYSALNSSATILYLDYYKKYFRPNASEKSSIGFLRWTTVIWGGLGILFSLLLINAKSALDIWWQISGIFGGGILGLFILAIFNIKINRLQGVLSVFFSVLIIVWGTFFRNLPLGYTIFECTLDPIIIGSIGTVGLILLALLFVVFNKYTKKLV
uniref:sodium:solute symporter family transporter n=1 Tax=Yeosuana marina TaxID=1565536 RepID=UPI003C6EF0FD